MDNETLKNLRERRSIRRYKKEQITEEQLNAILEAGTYAPTGMGAQSPLILVIQDAAVIAKLSGLNATVMGTRPRCWWCWRIGSVPPVWRTAVWLWAI